MKNEIKSIIPKLKKLLKHNDCIVVFPYKNKEHRKVVYKDSHNNLIEYILKYNYDLKDWNIVSF